MFKRLSDSLMSPKEVAKYYNEPFWKSLLFFLLMLLLLMVPTVADLATTDILSGDSKKIIKTAFKNEEIPFKIEDGVLVNINADHNYTYKNEKISNLHFVFTEKVENVNPSLELVTLSFCGDGIYIHIGMTKNKVLNYDKYDFLKNLDFSDKDYINTLNFWDRMYVVADDTINGMKPIIVTMYSISSFIEYAFTLIMLILLLSLFGKFRMGNYIKFGSIFKVSVYNITPLIFCYMFAALFGLGFLRIIGFIITSIFNIITINELLKDLYLKRKEGE